MGKLDNEVVRRCCSAAFDAHKSRSRFTLNKSVRTHAIFAFPCSWSVGDWFRREGFGESKVDPTLFPSLKVLGTGAVACANEAFSSRFRHILEATSLELEVTKAIKKKRKIVFTGHSSGGALAILATIWLLERRLDSCTPLCVTFGSPLVGDKAFGHAIRREGWSSYFQHIVFTRDITPCIALAPLEDIEAEFQAILQQWKPKKQASSSISLSGAGFDQLIVDFFTTVTNNAFSAASHDSCILRCCSSGIALLGAVGRTVEVSPYRPFGTFVFCCGGGRMVWVDNHDAVLQLLFYTLQLEDTYGNITAAVRYSVMDQQKNYKTEVKEYLKKMNIVELNRLDEIPLSPLDVSTGWTSNIDSALREMGLSVEARLSLRAAGEVEKEKARKQERVEGYYSKVQDYLAIFQAYRTLCEAKGMCYYDAFKLHRDLEDFKAYVDRFELIGIWEETREMFRNFELPDSFELDRKLVKIATDFRLLLEPIDIANYYRRGLYRDAGLYETDSNGRPKYYKYPESWLKHLQRFIPEDEEELGRGKVSFDSCFWARVENMCLELRKGTEFAEIERVVLEFEDEVRAWFDGGELGQDVLMEGSTFLKWWAMLPPHHRARSCIRERMEARCANGDVNFLGGSHI
ncbi:EDS1 protein [Nymphaea thermarum]|nr:EDS1 protein [Nymphaea thermarum]